MRLVLARWVARFCGMLVALTLAGAPVQAQTAIDLELVLPVDVSGSVSHDRFLLQQQGYVAAFRDPRLLQAIRTGAAQAIAVTMTQWTGPDLQLQEIGRASCRDRG